MFSKIGIIGGGNLGVAIAEGLIESGFAAPGHILITRRSVEQLQELEKRGVMVSRSNADALEYASLIILAVKPFQAMDVLSKLKDSFKAGKHVLVSVVSGTTINEMSSAIGGQVPVVRAMPNTAISIRESMTCLAAGADIPEEKFQDISDLFAQLGSVVRIDEKLMDAATVLAACGTAFAMRYIRANIQGGIEIGFNAATASLIAAQTVKGAAELLQKKGSHPEQEIDKVTTPRGTTITGLNEMEHRGFSSSLIKGLVASFDKMAKL
jgi:pyrroline-5-carboxylate reductase